MSYRPYATVVLRILAAFTFLMCPSLAAAQAPASIKFIQGNYAVPPTPQATVTVAFPGTQTAGNLNVVVVGWNASTPTVTSVTDSAGNSYTRAVGPTLRASQASQSMYFAPNIAAATGNVVTVRFSVAAVYPDIRILEYSGLDPVSPFLASAVGSGSSKTSSTGSLTTSVPNVLLVAGNIVATTTSGPGSGFTSRMITNPDGDIVEDRVVTTVGSYSATASLSSSGYWVMQMVAFKAAILSSPVANFSATPTSGAAPLAVQCTDTSTGSISTWAWSFGDGTSSNVQNPQHTYSTAGTYTVSLTVSGPGGSNTATKSSYITVTQPLSPVANFSATPTSGAAPLAVQCTDTSTGSISTWAWSFGDGTSSNVQNPQHTYSTAGTYTVSLTVSGPGGSSTATKSSYITVTQPLPPVANFSATPTSGAAPLTVQCTDTSTGSISTWAWSFGDGTSSNVQNPQHTYSTAGTYTVSLIVSGSGGSNTVTKGSYITVASGTPAPINFVQGNYAVPQTPQATVTVAFPGAQHAGNLNVVVVGWNDSTATVTSVTDSTGNSYTLAVGPTVRAGQASQSMYFAPNIAAATGNVVTVRFSVAAVYPDIRILEYSGLDPVSPFLASAVGSGSSATSSTGTLTTSVPNVLLVAGNIVATTTSGPGSGFTIRMITNPDGDIVEDRVVTTVGSYSATASLSVSGYWVMQMVAFKAAILPPDDTPPTINITAPAANATVTSTTTVTAAATDNIDVVGVQFFLDGAPLGLEVPDPPYSTLWDTTTAQPGSYTLTARARDAAGNATMSAAVPVTVRTTTVADIGQWSGVFNWPLVAVHATLLPNGDVLAWDGANQKGAAFIWRPATNTLTSDNPPDNIFCAGHTLLADGRVLVVGGHIANFDGIPDANIFGSGTGSWTQVRSMAYGRWYPTAITLPDGRVLVVAGDDGCPSCVAAVPEIYNVATDTWGQLPNAAYPFPEYPHLFVLPDGRVLATGSFEEAIATQVLDFSTQTWTVVDPAVVDGHSSVMYQLNKFLKSGTSATSDPPYKPATATTYLLDMAQAQPAWRETAPMVFSRSYHNLTLLPDGSVLATGGELRTDPFDQTQAVFAAELWSPSTGTWTAMAAMAVPRFYHSTALLLPDGRVLSAGGGRFGGTAVDDMLNAEIYSPPYLFKGSRPVITSVPTLFSYNSSFSIVTPSAAGIASVSLLRLGSVTHHFNSNQRYLSLSFQTTESGLNVQAPANANIAPPGYYMVFIVDTSGVPSVAATLRLQ